MSENKVLIEIGKSVWYTNKSTKKFVEYTVAHNSKEKWKYIPWKHTSIKYHLKDSFIMSNYTTRARSFMHTNEVTITYKNIPNWYSDEAFMNQTAILDQNLSKFYHFEPNKDAYIKFFKNKEKFKDATDFEIVKNSIKDFARSVILSSEDGKLFYVSLNKKNTLVTAENLISYSEQLLKLKEDDVAYIEELAREVLGITWESIINV